MSLIELHDLTKDYGEFDTSKQIEFKRSFWIR